MRVSATEAKNRFGSLSAIATREPVFVENAGCLDTVILSAENYQALQVSNDNTDHAARKRQFETEFGDWIAAQNPQVKKSGIPCADPRPC
jgi:PHD/YefM family antitoxin component YafN of YafNO toxin-antitoxin module